jgi:hypothetical protein
MAKKKMSKQAVKKAHRIGDAVKKKGGADNPYAVGMAVEKKKLAKQRRKKAAK